MSNVERVEPASGIKPDQLTELDIQNFTFIWHTFASIRTDAGAICNSLEEANLRLSKIYAMTDRMHNVPTLMSKGQPCDAKTLFLGISSKVNGCLNASITSEQTISDNVVDATAANCNNMIQLNVCT